MVLVDGVEIIEDPPPQQQQVQLKGKRFSCEGDLSRLTEGMNQGSLFQEGNDLFVLDSSGKKILKCSEQR